MKDHSDDRRPWNTTYNLGSEGRCNLSRFQLVPVHIAEEGLWLDWSMLTPGHAQSVAGIPFKQLQQRYSPAAQWLWPPMVTLLTVDILMACITYAQNTTTTKNNNKGYFSSTKSLKTRSALQHKRIVGKGSNTQKLYNVSLHKYGEWYIGTSLNLTTLPLKTKRESKSNRKKA